MRYPLAGLALGILLGLAFPTPGIWLLAWIVPGLLLLVAGTNEARNSFRIGFHGGLGFQLTALHWLLFIPMRLNAVLAWIALSSFLALFTGLWCWLNWRLLNPLLRNSAGQPIAPSAGSSFVPWALRFLVAAASWVAIEMVLARIFTGFPWTLVGVSQYKLLPLTQMAVFTGVYGVSFLVVWFSVALGISILLFRKKQFSLATVTAHLFLPLAVIAGLSGWGSNKVRNATSGEPASTLNLALVQPAFPQPLIWDAREKTNRFNALLDLSRQALAAKPDILVWPETSLPDFFTRHNAMAIGEIVRMAKSNNVWMVLGANDTRTYETNGTRKVDLFNSAFLVNPAGDLANRYHKRRLVIFGEYMPLRDRFPFLTRFRQGGGGLAAGVQDVPFELGPQKAKAAVLICFEDVFPHFVRQSVSPETDFLLNLTNDGWFGQGSAQWQHAAIAVFRAIENGLPLVRCTNNGLTCWVDSAGRLHEVYFGGSDDIHRPGFKLARIPVKASNPRPLTFYTRHGDVFGWSCVIFSVGIFLLFRLRGRTVL